MSTISVGETGPWIYHTSGISLFTRDVYVGQLDAVQDGSYPMRKGSHLSEQSIRRFKTSLVSNPVSAATGPLREMLLKSIVPLQLIGRIAQLF
jgi:hypothetical protein